MKKGDIVLIPFPFTDLSGSKKRPAVVLINSEMDVTLCFISSQLKWKSKYDVNVFPNQMNRLKKESLIRISKIATISKDLVIGILGHLNDSEMKNVNQSLVHILQLNK